MVLRTLFTLLFLLSSQLSGCSAASDANPSEEWDSTSPDATSEDVPVEQDFLGDEDAEDTSPDVAVAFPVQDPFLPGPFQVSESVTQATDTGAPLDFDLYVPQGDGPFAVVLFVHGFLVEKSLNRTVLRHLASHGFVVVAPQDYLADGLPFDKPTAFEEADSVAQLIVWLGDNWSSVSTTEVDMDRLGLAGHSRGGKVSWILRRDLPGRFLGFAGIDPVDGAGGPLGGEDRILDSTFSDGLPSLIVGTELGSIAVDIGFGEPTACAPEGDNHQRFYEVSPVPAWHVLALGLGHNDCLDASEDCGLVCALCPAGENPQDMKTLSGGLLAAFFSYALWGYEGPCAALVDPSPSLAQTEVKNK